MNDPQEVAERYAALWNEPDPSRRREGVRALWTPNGAQVLVDPPQETRAAADQLRFRKPSFEVHGHVALEARVTRAYEMFIAPGEFVFRSREGSVVLLPVWSPSTGRWCRRRTALTPAAAWTSSTSTTTAAS
jgi:hypothetical protein